MKLYYAPGACSLSPHIALAESGLKYDLVRVDLKSHQTEHGVDFYTVNPNGYVPLLVLDNGEQLTEGPAIVQYIADQAPAKALAPAAGTLDRYRVMQWLNFEASELHKSFSPLFNPTATEDMRAAARANLDRRFTYVNEHLSKNDYLVGNAFSVADIYLFVILSWAPYVNVDLSKWAALGAFSQRVGSRPAVTQALKEEGLIK